MFKKNFLRLFFIQLSALLFYFNFSLDAEEITNKAEENIVSEEQTVKKTSSSENGDKNSKSNIIVITATRTKEKQKDVPVHVNIITSKDIEATGATSVGDVLGQIETGHFHKYNGLQQPVGLSGDFRTDALGEDIKGYVLILVDGHRIGTGNMAKIPPETIEKIEIIKGPASALYGSAAMGGVINIITKKGRGKIETNIKNQYGSFDYMKGSASSGGNITDWFSYFISASYMHIGDYGTKKYGTVYNSNEDHKQIWGNLSLYPTDNQSIRLGFSYADLIAHYPEWENYKIYSRYSKTTNEYSDKSRGHSDMEYNLGLLNDKIHWKALFYFLWDRNAWYYRSFLSSVNDSASKDDSYTIGTDQQFTFSLLPYNKITAGYTFESLKKKSEAEYNYSPSNPSSPDMNYLINSLYAQDSIELFNNTANIIAGIRYDRFDVSTEKPKNSTYTDFSEKQDNFYHISPRGGFVYKPTDFIRIRANAGKAFKTPSAEQLTSQYNNNGIRILGNPDLKPETSISYEGGPDLYILDFNLGSTYILTNTKNKIQKTTYTVLFNGYNWYTFENIGKTRTQAVECYLNWEMSKTFNLPVTININSNVVFNLEYKNRNTGEDLYFVSDKEIKTNLSLGYKKAVITFFYVYVGKQKIENYDNYPVTTIETKHPFRYYDLTFKYSISSVIEANGGVFNLTNKNYEWARGYPMPERNYKIGLTGKF